jgi:hypothetical protein
VPPLPDPNSVFLNIPCDEEFTSLYVAYIVGLCQLSLVPHLTPEIPGGRRRLNKIIELIQLCRYSIHDLSRIEVRPAPSGVPRFNMPLELGMTITWQILNPEQHTWFVWESEHYRLQRSVSDLNGTDPNIHKGTPEGVLHELRDAFPRDRTPSVPEMLKVYRLVDSALNFILKQNGTRNPYSRSVFKDLCSLSLSLGAFYSPAKPAV